MLDVKFLRENPDLVRENIKKKFQEEKLPLVDEAIDLYDRKRAAQQEEQNLRAQRNALSKQIGALMGQGRKEEAEQTKKQVGEFAGRLDALTASVRELDEGLNQIMSVIPNIIDPSVPVGRDDTENVELERFGEPVSPCL